MRIYKLYKDMAQNDLKREKLSTIASLRKIRVERKEDHQEYNDLLEQNIHLKKTLKRYKKMIDNFEEEFENV